MARSVLTTAVCLKQRGFRTQEPSWSCALPAMPPVMPYVNQVTGDASFYPPLRKKGRSERSVTLHRLIVDPGNSVEDLLRIVSENAPFDTDNLISKLADSKNRSRLETPRISADLGAMENGKAQKVGGAGLDWKLVFGSRVDSHGFIKHVWKDGEWDKGELAIFEGQKVFHCKDGKVRSLPQRIFNDKANYARMTAGCQRMGMPTMTPEMFHQAIDRVVAANLDFVPPYGSGASLYVRPFMIGSGPQLGLGPSSEFTFMVLVSPVGPYYGGSVPCKLVDEFDRAAPLGVGQVKCAGNYAADIVPAKQAKDQGFPICLYLDAKEHKYVEEFSTSNFAAITKNVYLTPDSSSVLGSVTNMCLEVLAKDMGLTVERRRIDFEAEVSNFKEVGAVGTGVVITVVESITRGEKKYTFEQPSETLQSMYNKLRAIQVGDEPDKFGWLREISA
eukprot:s302_g5.t1